MGVLLSGLLGIFGSTLPEVFKFFQDKKDKEHELAIMQLQIQRDKDLGIQQANSIELQSDASTLTAALQSVKTGIVWVDALSGTVRPVITYIEILLYVLAKLLAVHLATDIDTDFLTNVLWTDFDENILAVILGFWFANRAFVKSRL